MTFWGITRSGSRLALGAPASAVFSLDADAPADLLRARFPAESLWEELREVEVQRDGETVFHGVVDEQIATLDGSGVTVELVCRSLEALLLDSEAPPGVITGPTLEVLEERLLLPLGLALGRGDRARKMGQLAVSKGESCWTALARFCAGALGAVPWVDPRGRVHCDGQPGARLVLADVISAQVRFLPCKRLSQVWMQSARGTYDTPFPGTGSLPRRRYVSAQSGKNPKALVARGERESFRLAVTVAGEVWPGKNARVDVTVPGLGRFEGCPVKSARLRRDASGTRTELTLERGESTCG